VPTENFSTELVNFVAGSEDIFNIWTDGINVLLGKQVNNCPQFCNFICNYTLNYLCIDL